MQRTIRNVGLISLAIIVLAGSAFGFSTIFTFQGTVTSYDFGTFGPGYAVPGTVEIQAFTMKPGDVVPWHYHTGLSYVIVVHGTLTEQDSVGGQCGVPTLNGPGSAFVEAAGRIHTVSNPGPGAAIIYWATVFPQGDPNGDAVFVTPPNCL